MPARDLTDTCHGTLGVLILVLAGIWMIGSGWAAYHHPERSRFWTDATSLWLTKKLHGEEESDKLARRLRDESRTRRSGKVGMAVGIFLVMGPLWCLYYWLAVSFEPRQSATGLLQPREW